MLLPGLGPVLGTLSILSFLFSRELWNMTVAQQRRRKPKNMVISPVVKYLSRCFCVISQLSKAIMWFSFYRHRNKLRGVKPITPVRDGEGWILIHLLACAHFTYIIHFMSCLFLRTLIIFLCVTVCFL